MHLETQQVARLTISTTSHLDLCAREIDLGTADILSLMQCNGFNPQGMSVPEPLFM
jgi:hypothetical protein